MLLCNLKSKAINKFIYNRINEVFIVHKIILFFKKRSQLNFLLSRKIPCELPTIWKIFFTQENAREIFVIVYYDLNFQTSFSCISLKYQLVSYSVAPLYHQVPRNQISHFQWHILLNNQIPCDNALVITPSSVEAFRRTCSMLRNQVIAIAIANEDHGIEIFKASR